MEWQALQTGADRMGETTVTTGETARTAWNEAEKQLIVDSRIGEERGQKCMNLMKRCGTCALQLRQQQSD
jgi:hypothetical protein